VAERAEWREQVAQIKRMHGWLLEVEQMLDGSLLQETGERVSNETVGSRLDTWRTRMSKQPSDDTLPEREQQCLVEFLRVRSHLRPYLVRCYDRTDFPRTNSEMERSIRRLKTQDRRVSGRTNWNAYLLRYGRGVAYAAWWEQDAAHRQQFEQRAAPLNHAHWRVFRQQTTATHREQLTRLRFRHKRQAFLASLEARWEATAPTLPLP
jgi:hypothetical protein